MSKKISELDLRDTITGDEEFPVSIDGLNQKINIKSLGLISGIKLGDQLYKIDDSGFIELPLIDLEVTLEGGGTVNYKIVGIDA